MKRISVSVLVISFLLMISGFAFAAADHSQFSELRGNFNSKSDVTKECVVCHPGVPVTADDIHMQPVGKKMECIDCHTEKAPNAKFKASQVTAASCERCHTVNPHTEVLEVKSADAKEPAGLKGRYNPLNYMALLAGRDAGCDSFENRLLDSHRKMVSCQACHIDHFSAKAEGVTAGYQLEKGQVCPVFFGKAAEEGAAPEVECFVNHGVTDAGQSLKCEDCHSRDGRFSSIEAGWVPGKDRSFFLDIVGILMLLGAIAGVAGHGFLRYRASKK